MKSHHIRYNRHHYWCAGSWFVFCDILYAPIWFLIRHSSFYWSLALSLNFAGVQRIKLQKLYLNHNHSTDDTCNGNKENNWLDHLCQAFFLSNESVPQLEGYFTHHHFFSRNDITNRQMLKWNLCERKRTFRSSFDEISLSLPWSSKYVLNQTNGFHAEKITFQSCCNLQRMQRFEWFEKWRKAKYLPRKVCVACKFHSITNQDCPSEWFTRILCVIYLPCNSIGFCSDSKHWFSSLQFIGVCIMQSSTWFVPFPIVFEGTI